MSPYDIYKNATEDALYIDERYINVKIILMIWTLLVY